MHPTTERQGARTDTRRARMIESARTPGRGVWKRSKFSDLQQNQGSAHARARRTTFDENTLGSIWARDRKLSREARDSLRKLTMTDKKKPAALAKVALRLSWPPGPPKPKCLKRRSLQKRRPGPTDLQPSARQKLRLHFKRSGQVLPARRQLPRISLKMPNATLFYRGAFLGAPQTTEDISFPMQLRHQPHPPVHARRHRQLHR